MSMLVNDIQIFCAIWAMGFSFKRQTRLCVMTTQKTTRGGRRLAVISEDLLFDLFPCISYFQGVSVDHIILVDIAQVLHGLLAHYP